MSRSAERTRWLETARGLCPLAREVADRAEREGHLPEHAARAFAEAGLHRVAAPRFVGGAELDPASQIEIIEAVAEADGSAGWNLMIGIENLGFLGAILPEARARELFADPGLIVCGTLNPLGTAVREPGGYRVRGRWPFISGCHNASHFWARCSVPGEGGKARMLECLVPMERCQIHDTWEVSGLRGSGSCDVSVEDLFVPDDCMTESFRGMRYTDGPLFHLPVFSRLNYDKVGVALGIARAALTHFRELAEGKAPFAFGRPLRDRPDAQLAVAEAEATLGPARAWVMEAVDALWSAVVHRGEADEPTRARSHLACTHAASACVRAVDIVCLAAGATANFRASPLERRARDVRVVRQHTMISPQWNAAAGRVLLGLPSGTPFF